MDNNYKIFNNQKIEYEINEQNTISLNQLYIYIFTKHYYNNMYFVFPNGQT
jgi:hypothetical protein